jgi:hypothetical protein
MYNDFSNDERAFRIRTNKKNSEIILFALKFPQ